MTNQESAVIFSALDWYHQIISTDTLKDRVREYVNRDSHKSEEIEPINTSGFHGAELFNTWEKLNEVIAWIKKHDTK